MLRSIAAALIVTIVLAAAPASAQLLTDDGQLYGYFDRTTKAVPITGLGAGEKILAIDRARVPNELYGISATRLYLINQGTAAATPLGPAGAFDLAGSSRVDMDISDAYIRIISDTQSFRLDRTGAFVGSNAPFAYRPGDPNAGRPANIVAIAYGVYNGGLIGVDADSDSWVHIDDDSAMLRTIGALGVDVSEDAALDLSGSTGRATLLTHPNGSSASVFYQIDPGTERVRYTGTYNGPYHFIDFADLTVPEPSAWAMMIGGFGAIGAITRRARRQRQPAFG